MGKRRREGRDYTLAARRHSSNINLAKITTINFKDVELLEYFITEKGKILSARLLGVSAKHQKKITSAVKLARNIALISFSEGYVKSSAHNETPASNEEVADTNTEA